jgi:predicted dehydrogenase
MLAAAAAFAQAEPLRVGIAGLVHGHAGGYFRSHLTRTDLNIVGVSEPDAAVAKQYIDRFKIDPAKVYRTHAEMLDKAKPEAVMIFSSTFDHKEIVELCAARKIPVMMEKPLAVSMDHARAIAAAAKRSGIPVLVNYETTWYPVNTPIRTMLKDGKLGEIRRMVTHYGHQGPREIGVGNEFFDWLTDPVKNGAGALFDFGCYGANFANWLLNNERPLSVFAVTHTNKPDIYPKVDDEATIVVQYAKAQLLIQPSWNWPFNRKDMEVYGQKGHIITSDPRRYRHRAAGAREDTAETAGPLPAPEDDVIRYLTAVTRKQIQPAPNDLSSLENNMLVTEILEAARESARTGKAVRLR